MSKSKIPSREIVIWHSNYLKKLRIFDFLVLKCSKSAPCSQMKLFSDHWKFLTLLFDITQRGSRDRWMGSVWVRPYWIHLDCGSSSHINTSLSSSKYLVNRVISGLDMTHGAEISLLFDDWWQHPYGWLHHDLIQLPVKRYHHLCNICYLQIEAFPTWMLLWITLYVLLSRIQIFILNLQR